MEKNTQAELRAHLIETEPEFRRLANEHAMLKAQLEAIESRERVSLEDEIEESRLKKLKLRLKDEMSEFMAKHATHQAA
jgi:uncharacterized protein